MNLWNSVPEKYQQIIIEEFTKGTVYARNELTKFGPEMIEVSQTMGYEVNVLTLEERALFVEKTQCVYENFAGKFKDILPFIEKGKQEFAMQRENYAYDY